MRRTAYTAKITFEKDNTANQVSESHQPSPFTATDLTLSSETTDKHENNSYKNKYCKKCGSLIDGETGICTGCNKKYFKFRARYIYYTASFALILFLSLTSYNFYSLYCNEIEHSQSLQDKNSNQAKEITRLRGDIIDLEIDINNLKKTNSENEDTNSENKSGNFKDLDIILENHGYVRSEKEKQAQIQPSYIQEEDEVTCAIPSCDNTPSNNSFYCSRHECSEYGCHNLKANDLCRYCTEHKCMYPDCNYGCSYNSYYCFLHK